VARFERDTAVRREGDRLLATLSPAWEVWGPFGGYVVAVALRAMGAATELRRPASFACSFLSVARFGDVELDVKTLRRGKRSHALRVEMSQGGEPILCAQGWAVADGMDGLVHEHATMPDVLPPDRVPSFAERAPNYDEWYPIWRSVDGKPTVWSEERRPPIWHTWMRLVETPPLDDPFLEAARTAMWMDMMMWNAAVGPHGFPISHLAPSLDLGIVFHGAAPKDEWLLCDSVAPIARDGVVGCTGRLWTPGGALVASGTSTLMCRPNPMAAKG
jgi:acyl-CoA thioesterase II